MNRLLVTGELTRRRKVYSPFLARYLALGLEIRLIADYGETEVSRKQSLRAVKWARELLEQLKEGRSHG